MSGQVRYETKEYGTQKYFDINSTYRDRKNYPNPSDFVIPYNINGQKNNAFTAIDPVVLGVPFMTGTIPTGSGTGTIVILNSAQGASNINNFYINQILQIGNQFLTITAYSGLDVYAATVSGTGFVDTSIGLEYQIRGQRPVYIGNATNTSRTNISLSSTLTPASQTDNIYRGMYLRATSGASAGEIALINNYTGGLVKTTNLQTTLLTPISTGDGIEILEFSRDNVVPLIYSGTDIFNQPVCYRMRLLSLTIPNLTLNIGRGGTIANYPYLYVKFSIDGDNSSTQTLYTNNPNAKTVQFKVPITTSDYTLSESFIDLRASEETQTIKFKPNSSLRFTVTLPSGEILSFVQPDNYSPLAPNDLVQISATIEIERII